MKIKIGVLGSTKGTDLQAIIDAIAAKELDAQIVVVISDKPDSYILERAKKYNIETFVINYKAFPKREDAEKEIAKKLKSKNVELILLIGFMKVITPYLISEFEHRIWNIHPSLLPKYAGGMNLDVHKQVIKNHETQTGCTLHEVTENIDAGKIILQKKVKILPGDTPDTLKEKVQKSEQECLLEAIKMVIDGKLHIGK